MSIIVDRTGYFGETSELCSKIYLMGQKLWKYGSEIVVGQVFHSRDGWMDGLKRGVENNDCRARFFRIVLNGRIS